MYRTDKEGVLKEVDSNDAICMETIQSKLSKYNSIAEFKVKKNTIAL